VWRRWRVEENEVNSAN